MSKKKFKIGETFQFGFVKLRVEKPDSNDLFLCEKCFFNGGCCIDTIVRRLKERK